MRAEVASCQPAVPSCWLIVSEVLIGTAKAGIMVERNLFCIYNSINSLFFIWFFLQPGENCASHSREVSNGAEGKGIPLSNVLSFLGNKDREGGHRQPRETVQ